MSAVYVRKPFYVEADRVAEENILEIAEWCGGDIVVGVPKGKNETVEYIKVPVLRPASVRHTQAYIGDYVLKVGKSFKVYTEKAFRKDFALSAGPGDDIHPDWLVAEDIPGEDTVDQATATLLRSIFSAEQIDLERVEGHTRLSEDK